MEIQGHIENQWYLKSPFEKGGFRGISGAYKIPPTPPFSKGGIKATSKQAHKLFFNDLIGLLFGFQALLQQPGRL
jgi:hypothetical protein